MQGAAAGQYKNPLDIAKTAEREPTLSERLTRASDSIDAQCQNLALLLCRLNGTPPAPEQTINKAQPQGGRSLISLVASAEGQANHLRELVKELERIG